MPDEDAPVVLIVGGGYAGIEIAKELDSVAKVVIVERKDYFLHNVGTPRAFVHPEFIESCAIPYDKLLKNGCVVQATVKSISPKKVTLAGNLELEKFDYLVVATGASYAFPFNISQCKRSELSGLFESVAKEISEARSVVVAGGGSTGLEAAGEIAEKYPDCKVTLVHSGPNVMMPGPWPSKFIKLLESQLAKLPNVELVLEDRIVPITDQDPTKKYCTCTEVFTEKGRNIKCDLLFWCVGGKMNSASYEDSLPLSSKGKCIQVDEYLRVKGFENIFAAGDCADSGNAKTVNFADQHGASIGANLKRLIKSKPMKPYKGGPDLNVTQIGHKLGAGYIPPFGGIVIGPKVVQSIKVDMFAGKFWKTMGRKPPKKNEKVKMSDEIISFEKLQAILDIDSGDARRLARGECVGELSSTAEYT